MSNFNKNKENDYNNLNIHYNLDKKNNFNKYNINNNDVYEQNYIPIYNKIGNINPDINNIKARLINLKIDKYLNHKFNDNNNKIGDNDDIFNKCRYKNKDYKGIQINNDYNGNKDNNNLPILKKIIIL